MNGKPIAEQVNLRNSSSEDRLAMTLEFQSATMQKVMVQVMIDDEWRDTREESINTLSIDRHDKAADGAGRMLIDVDSYLMPGKDGKLQRIMLKGNVEYFVRLLLVLPDAEDEQFLLAGTITL